MDSIVFLDMSLHPLYPNLNLDPSNHLQLKGLENEDLDPLRTLFKNKE